MIGKNFKEASELLREVLKALNYIPNRNLTRSYSSYRNTYELAAKIDDFLNRIKNEQ